MTPQEPQRSVEEELLVSTIYDWIDLGYLRSTVRELNHVGSPDLHAASMTVVARLIGDGLVAAGDVTEGQFRAWDCTREEAIARIDKEWQAASDPELWPFQVAALAPTDEGVRVVAQVLAREGEGKSWQKPRTQKPLAIVRSPHG
ncbi:hypothetical protein [Terrabacter sp. NPDC080008]|uniref:hypothetical protein n=1 Tax=Terrabacter sp. NPDC080008 TaxID=3155176 RepID=UPI00344C6DC2